MSGDDEREPAPDGRVVPPDLAALVARIEGCRLCRDAPWSKPLPHEPRPVLRPSATARILIAGQAPGTRVHASGVPFSDPSGDRLRDWMGIGPEVFYDRARIAIVPMGFCFPGHDAHGGDLPPRRECAPTWGQAVMAAMPSIDLVLAVGGSAQRWHLGGDVGASVTATVADWRRHLARSPGPAVLPLPHPSWRNSAWLKRHAWFAAELVPALRTLVAERLAHAPGDRLP